MALSIIGSGFGRTGTKSLKEAVELLGYAPCHHMHEIVEHPEQVAHWQALAAGKPVDWNEVFAGYKSQVDWPGAYVWRQLSEAFPEAKVVHSTRPADAWWNSYSKTIAKLMTNYENIPLPPHISNMMTAWIDMVARHTFGGKFADRDTCIAAFQRHDQEVRETIPANRLLVFNVADGWEPLCNFLNVPIPATAFPHRNLRADFWEVLGGEPA